MVPTNGFDGDGFVRDMNDSLQAVGWWRERLYEGGAKPVLITPSGVTELPDVGGQAATFGKAYAIDEFGTIVGKVIGRDGSTPVLWSDGTAYNLRDRVIGNPGDVFLFAAYDINARGQIVVHAMRSGEASLYLLTPVPEPATVGLLAVGGGVMVWRVARTRSRRA